MTQVSVVSVSSFFPKFRSKCPLSWAAEERGGEDFTSERSESFEMIQVRVLSLLK